MRNSFTRRVIAAVQETLMKKNRALIIALSVFILISAIAALGYVGYKKYYADPFRNIVAGLSSGGKMVEGDFEEYNDQAYSSGASEKDKNYDLSSLIILTRVLSYINTNYYDPSRINPRDMTAEALNAMQRVAAELLVKFNVDKTLVTVTVDQKSKTFDVSKIKKIFDIQYSMSEIMDFVQKNLRSKDVKKKDIEYAAINGILTTLDPHSTLMNPKSYEELKMSTRGNFGGLGIVIGMKDGTLTIVTPYEGTPAWKAGLKAGDKIVEINGQSTVNMSLDEAVKMMRGPKGTTCAIKIMRKGWKTPKAHSITRDTINIPSVTSKILEDRYGYVRVDGFQGNTTRDLKAHLKELHAKAGKGGLAGLTLDLRGNPGGLLDQAIEFSDVFLNEGTIVSTVGAHNIKREKNEANAGGTEPLYPIVVLIDGNSASAAEIVSGALKNNNRAITVGDRSFGKGTVQMLYEFEDGSALKLTVAQYLTPGDISIQNVGVTPDIRLTPTLIGKDELIYYTAGEGERESDLEKTLENVKKSDAPDKPRYTVKYLYDEKRDKENEELKGRRDYVQEDYSIQFALGALKVLATEGDRLKGLEKLAGYVQTSGAAEDEKVAKALSALNIDYSTGENAKGGLPQLTIAFGKNGTVKAGETETVSVEAKNIGTSPLYRLHAVSKCDDRVFDKYELLIGKLMPGETKKLSFPIKIEKDALSRSDIVTFVVSDGFDNAYLPVSVKVKIAPITPPRFVYSYVIDDLKGGNGDGRLQPGEEIDVILNVKNVGEGKAHKGIGTLRTHELNPDVFVSAGRVLFDEVAPDASVSFSFHIQLKPTLKAKEIAFDLLLGDSDLHQYITDELRIKLASPRPKGSSPETGLLETINAAELYSYPGDDAGACYKIPAKSLLKVLSQSDDWHLVNLKDDANAWIKNKDVRPAKVKTSEKNAATKIAGELTTLYFRRAPKIALDSKEIEQITDASAVKISGQASDDNRTMDVYIVNNKSKVYFFANAAAENTEAGKVLNFDALVPLEEGVNKIMIIARENERFAGSETIIIYRPKTEKSSDQQGEGKKSGSESGDASEQ